jgi:DNA polymerase III subunit epsilon
MGDVLGHLLELCRDSVLVAHNLPFEEKFLAHELRRHGVRVQGMPGLCTLATTRRVLQLPNYKLGTVAQMLGLDAVATHAALDDARACARLTATLITEHGMALTAKPRFTRLPELRTAGRLTPRAAALRAGDRGWMASLMDRLPVMSLYPTDPALEAAYIDLLTEALADGKITGAEAKALATQARTAGMSAADVRRVHTSVLTGLREVAEADGIITPAEERDLCKTANALGVPETLTDLVTARHRNRRANVSTPVRRCPHREYSYSVPRPPRRNSGPGQYREAPGSRRT